MIDLPLQILSSTYFDPTSSYTSGHPTDPGAGHPRLGNSMQRIARLSANGASHMNSVAVVGAGVSGSVCAQTLSKAGVNVTIFDQGWTAPGGRTSSRQTTFNGTLSASGTIRFDQGCQFFRATPGMQPMIDDWLHSGKQPGITKK